MRLVNWRALAIGVVGLGLAACGDDVTVTPTPPVITLNPQSVTCAPGGVTAVGVTVTGGSNTSIAFSAGGSGITVTPNGTAGATVTCGTTPGAAVVNVTVTSGGQTYTTAIPVTITGGTQANVVAISLAPAAATLAPGATTTIVPTVTLANGAPANTSTDVTYTSSSTAVTVTRNANNTATVTVAANAAAGTQAVITAVPNANTNLRASAVITVGNASSLVSGITVSPTTVGLNVGGTQAITTSVQLAAGAPAGTSQNVTCSSSNTSVVTVNNGTAPGGTSCTVTAVGNGTATITVASVAAPSVTQLVNVNVTALAPVRLTIQGINVVGPAGTQIPADVNNVNGNLFLTMNLDPGDNRPDSVVVTIGGQRVNCQKFSVQLQQAYRDALLSGSADVQPITCQINTSQFDATTGATLVQNGQQALSATVFYRTGTAGTGASTQQTATIQQNLTVNNTSGFFVGVTNTPSATQLANGSPANGQATGPQGVLWRNGSITVNVLPVNFTPVVNPGTQSFQVQLVDANGVIEQRTATQGATGAAFTVTFPGDQGDVFDNTAAFGQRSLAGYTSPNAGIAPAFNNGAYVGGGTLVVIGTSIGTSNTTILNAAGVPTGGAAFAGITNAVPTPIFIDDQTPQPAVNFGGAGGPPTANFAFTGSSFVGFINGAFNFQNSLAPQFLSTAANAASALSGTNPDYNGVDRVTTQFFAGSSTSANTLTGGTAITTGAALSPSTTNTANNLAVSLVDALGNRRNQRVGTGANGANLAINGTGTAVSGNNFLSFGVDITAPTIAQTAGPTANTVTGANANVTLQFAGSDETGFGQNPILVTMTRTARITSTTSPIGNQQDVASNSSAVSSAPSTYCATAIDQAGNVTFADTPGGTCNAIATQGSVTIPAGLNGQYSITAQARDQAGNVSGTINRIVVVDTKAPIIGGIGLPQTIVGNQPATFPTSATDNLELGSARGEVDYGALLALAYPTTTIGSPFDNSFVASMNPINITIPSFIRSVTPATAGPPSATRQVATNFRGVVFDLAGNLAFSNLGIPAANLGNLSATSPFNNPANPVTNVFGFQLQAATGNNTPAAGVNLTISGGAAANTPTSATLQVFQSGAVNTFISPFQRIELYVQVPAIPGSGAAPTYRFIGTVPAGLVQDNAPATPGFRTITSQFTLTPSTSPLITAPANGQNTYTIIAVGVNANGDALVCATN